MTHPAHGPSHVPDLLLERYRLGEMAPAELERMQERLAADELLRQRLLALEDSDDDVGRQYTRDRLAAQVQERLRSSVPRRVPSPAGFGLRWILPVAAAAAVVALAVGSQVLFPFRTPAEEARPDGPASGDRLKGHDLALFRKTAAGSEMLGDGDRVRAGDLIRIGYRGTGRGYGVIVSVDDRGAVTRHLPQQGDGAEPLARTGQTLLSHAYELDDAPKWERFYFVTAREPFDIAPVVDAARRAAAAAGAGTPGALVLPATFDQSSLVLLKEVGQ